MEHDLNVSKKRERKTKKVGMSGIFREEEGKGQIFQRLGEQRWRE